MENITLSLGNISIAVTVVAGLVWLLKTINIIKNWRTKKDDGVDTLQQVAELVNAIITSGAVVAASIVTESAFHITQTINRNYSIIEERYNQVNESITNNQTVTFSGQSGSTSDAWSKLFDQLSALPEQFSDTLEEEVGALEQQLLDLSGATSTIALDLEQIEQALSSFENKSDDLSDEIGEHYELTAQLILELGSEVGNVLQWIDNLERSVGLLFSMIEERLENTLADDLRELIRHTDEQGVPLEISVVEATINKHFDGAGDGTYAFSIGDYWFELQDDSVDIDSRLK